VDKFTMMAGDLLRVGWGLVFFELIIVLLLVVSAIHGLVVLIRLLVNRIRKKEQSFALLRAGIAAALVLLIINLFIVVISALSITLTLSAANIHGIIQILLTLTVITCTIILLLKLKKPKLSKKQKRQIITPAIMCAIMIINTIYWQFLVFWI